MSLARVTAFALDGVGSRRVTVEADLRQGLPAFTIVGLADKAVREARERVRGALVNSGFTFPGLRITVNLAPAHLRKVGPGFDLPLAVAILVAGGQLEPVDGWALAGELGLTGELRPIPGALSIAEGARRHGIERVMVPRSRALEAALVEGVEVAGVESLVEAVAVLRGDADAPPLPDADPADGVEHGVDLAEVRGHNALIPSIEVAVAGGHNLYLHGPPGTGKTMLARRIPTLLPPMTADEAIEVTRIHSVAGFHVAGRLLAERPFRAPHHQISAPGLVGGGSSPLPGEVTLAHNGVLFLDELSEFPRSALEALRQPLEDGRVVVVRSQRVVTYPSRCMLVAASNPCPCGHGPESSDCRCSAADLARHARRLSGPLLDRIDVTVAVGRPSSEALRTQAAPTSASVRDRVVAARERQAARFTGHPIACNAQMTPRAVRDLAAISADARDVLHAVHDAHRLSARGHHRILRVARTIADLEGADTVSGAHIAAALAMRTDTTARAALAA